MAHPLHVPQPHGSAHPTQARRFCLVEPSPKEPIMRSNHPLLPVHPILRPAFTAMALFLAGQQSAQAVAWNTALNGGNWVWLNPTTAGVGIGLAGNMVPLEKLTISGGSIQVDNNRFLKGKTTGGGLMNVIGLDLTNAVNIYSGRLVVRGDGVVTMVHAGLNGSLNVNGSANINSGATIGNGLRVNGRLGVNFDSPVSDFYVLGKSNFNGPVNITGGNVAIDTRLVANGGLEAAWITVLGDLDVSGSKNFVHPHPTDDTKKIVYVAAEAGEALTLARGISRTENGKISVQLPDHFALVTSEDAPLTVQLTVEGAPALIYVVSKSRQAIEVKMKDSDFAEFQDVTFNYFVQGVRDGFEDHIAIQDIDPAGNVQPSARRARYVERVKKAFPGARKRSH